MRTPDDRRGHTETTAAAPSRPAPGRRTRTSRLPGTIASLARSEPSGAPTGTIQARAAGGASTDLGAMLDAAVRPDLFAGRPAATVGGGPVQLRAAVVAGDPAAATATAAGGGGGGGGGGRATALPDGLRVQMERSLGADFSGVQVREDASATALGADAYARGDQITFAPGRYDASSTAGKELIGHELVHVVQQRQGRVAATQARGGTAINADPGLEREADELGARAARGEVATGAPAPGGPVRGDAAQLRPGKVKRPGVRARLGADEEVDLLPGTAIDVEDRAVEILTGSHKGKRGELIAVRDGDLLFEAEPDREVGDNHEIYPGCSTGFVGLPEAVAIDGEMLVVRALVQTRNLFDRIRLKLAFKHPDSPEGPAAAAATGVRDDQIDAQNPPWGTDGDPIGHRGYVFKPRFTGFAGTARPSALRTVEVRIPLRRIRAYYHDRLARWNDTDICIQLGLDMYYGGKGPAVATEAERATAYPGTDPRAHQYGFGATSSPHSLGRVTLSGAVIRRLGELGMAVGAGARMSAPEYHAQELGENPPNSLELPFPADYGERHPEFLPLVPSRFLERDDDDHAVLGLDRGSTEMQLKLQTRIENEATLKVSSLDGLQQIVGLLTTWGEDGGDVTGLLAARDPLLRNFTWSLEKKKPMVFTDAYLDDSSFNALRAGLGIRKRRSKEAAKLNVKTGAGYNVKTPSRGARPGEAYPEDRERGEASDIFRRHEIGFSLDPDATPEQIGAFLASGSDGHDPWNLGAQQSNLGLERPVDFGDLHEQMVLIGDRTKFNLRAVPRDGKGVINIEISCDHTVGCRAADWNIDPNRDDFDFREWHRRRDERLFPETFNVEMELEHLGAGGSTEAGGVGGASSSDDSTRGTMWGKPSEIRRRAAEERHPRRGPPVGFPDRRPYTKADAANPAFGTQSFSVFYAAHRRVIELLRDRCRLPMGDLGADVQKLEAIRDKLGLLDD